MRSSTVATLAHDAARMAQLHHHDGDGAIHYDDSDESVAHAGEHSAPVQLFLINRLHSVLSVSLFSLADYPEPASYIPYPFLDDPQRPPAFAPGLATGG
ncbi:hypothetical protein [Massilia sp. TSP1-1-2]|uniref:hypothetical protein n=1 Tax=unclassified Massilia TaxID=2609279 RepID=UPI003CF85E62